MDKKALREKYEKLILVHEEMANRLKELNPDQSKYHNGLSRAYLEILTDLNK